MMDLDGSGEWSEVVSRFMADLCPARLQEFVTACCSPCGAATVVKSLRRLILESGHEDITLLGFCTQRCICHAEPASASFPAYVHVF